ncbi:MAG: hypothetical protein OHK0013_47950 [Sandaracinaceae bacterium]
MARRGKLAVVPSYVTIGLSALSAAFFSLGLSRSRRYLEETLVAVGRSERDDVGDSYRAQRRVEPDPRAPLHLAIAARALGWLALMGLVWLVNLPVQLVDLTDEPHRRLGLVPADDRLVVAHAALAVLVLATSIGAAVARGWVRQLEDAAPPRAELERARPLAAATVLSSVASLGGAATAGAVWNGTPIYLYWLHAILTNCVVYAVCAALTCLATARAWRSLRSWRTTER